MEIDIVQNPFGLNFYFRFVEKLCQPVEFILVYLPVHDNDSIVKVSSLDEIMFCQKFQFMQKNKGATRCNLFFEFFQVIQATAVFTVVCNLVSLWKQEAMQPGVVPYAKGERRPRFREAWATFVAGGSAVRLLVASGLGFFAFNLQPKAKRSSSGRRPCLEP
jgi:hypothetical protein